MPFKKGQSGNPSGRPKGARHKLTEAFWKDFAGVWETSGKDALEKVVKDDPSTFVRVAASVMPKEFEGTIRTIAASQMSDDELADIAAGRGEGAVEAPLDTSKLN